MSMIKGGLFIPSRPRRRPRRRNRSLFSISRAKVRGRRSEVSWTWDLADGFGNARDDLDSDPFFYSYITFNTATAQTTRTTPAAQTPLDWN